MIWRKIAAGDPVDAPLGEWAYVTPAQPSGLTKFALQRSSADVQRETALFWFLLNYTPYDVSGPEWFGFGSSGRSGFNVGVLAPSPMIAFDILKREFGDILRPNIPHDLGDGLPGQWMLARLPIAAPRGDSKPDASSLRAALLAHLEVISSTLRSLEPDHGGLGHNRPPGTEPPLTEAERIEGIAAVDQAIAGLSAGDEDGARSLTRVVSIIAPIAQKLGNWALARLDDFFTEMAKAAGKSIREKLPWILFAMIASATIWSEAASIAQLADIFVG